MSTKDFATRTITINRKNTSVPNEYVVALDIGYSGVKGFSANKVFCFPAVVHQAQEEGNGLFSGNATDKITYRDDEGTWVVGNAAMKMFTTRDLSTSDEIMFARQRYNTKEFLICARVGIALGVTPNEFGTAKGKALKLQTGLPPKFVRQDSPLLRQALTGEHKFSVKFGDGKWKDYSFKLGGSDIFIMSQPMGSLYSVSMDRNANLVTTAEEYFVDGSVIFDGGFGTLDVFSVVSNDFEASASLNLSMKEVLARTKKELSHTYNAEFSVYDLMTRLHSGTAKFFDPQKKKTQEVNFSSILEKHNKAVCSEALGKLDSIYNFMQDYRYLIVAGGTGEAWFPMIRKHYEKNDIEVILSTVNDDLPGIFSNVRGYYIYRIGSMKREAQSS